MSKQLKSPAEPEVDFVNLAKTIWARRMLVVKLTGIAAITGFILSILEPVRYTASTTLVQEITDPKITLNEARLSAISALASVAGVDLNGLTKAKMSPQTYSDILTSVPFRKELMNTKLNFGRTDTAITLYDYYTKRAKDHPLISFTIGLPSRIINALKREPGSENSQTNPHDIPQLTREEMNLNEILDKQITLQILDDEYILIRCTLPEAYAAAQLTRRTGELLQHYLTEIQTEKARVNLQFIQERNDEAKNNFLKIQEELVALPAGKEDLRLSAAYRLAENIYSELTRKLELSKIALREQTPVFKIIDPVTVPTGKSSPNRTKIAAIFSFFGFVLAMILILGKGFFEATKEKWNK